MRPNAMTSPADQVGWYKRWLSSRSGHPRYMRTYTVRAFQKPVTEITLGSLQS